MRGNACNVQCLMCILCVIYYEMCCEISGVSTEWSIGGWNLADHHWHESWQKHRPHSSFHLHCWCSVWSHSQRIRRLTSVSRRLHVISRQWCAHQILIKKTYQNLIRKSEMSVYADAALLRFNRSYGTFVNMQIHTLCRILFDLMIAG